jgi:hypothetical protein
MVSPVVLAVPLLDAVVAAVELQPDTIAPMISKVQKLNLLMPLCRATLMPRPNGTHLHLCEFASRTRYICLEISRFFLKTFTVHQQFGEVVRNSREKADFSSMSCVRCDTLRAIIGALALSLNRD